MTFSQSVKIEIFHSVRNSKKCCAKSFLTAVLKAVGSLALGHDGYGFTVESDNPDFLSLLSNIAAERLSVTSHIDAYNVSAKGTAVYSCKFDSSLGEKLGLMTRDADGDLVFAEATKLIPSDGCCRKSFLQGLFAASGSVVIPDTENVADSADNPNYHLELRFADADFAKAVGDAFPLAGFRQTPRKTHTVLYLKDSERIADFLVYVNASSAKLRLENVIIARSVRNGLNRQNNCEVANIGKTVAASSRQIKAIAYLRDQGRFDELPDNLKEIALARESDPEATLEEIADRLHISKSGANHRLVKLIEIADKQRKIK